MVQANKSPIMNHSYHATNPDDDSFTDTRGDHGMDGS